MLVRELHHEVLAAALLNRDRLRLLHRQLRQLTLLKLLLQLGEIDVSRVLTAGVDKLVNQQRTGHNQQPKDDLSRGRTQNLPASVAHDTVKPLELSLLIKSTFP